MAAAALLTAGSQLLGSLGSSPGPTGGGPLVSGASHDGPITFGGSVTGGTTAQSVVPWIVLGVVALVFVKGLK